MANLIRIGNLKMNTGVSTSTPTIQNPSIQTDNGSRPYELNRTQLSSVPKENTPVTIQNFSGLIGLGAALGLNQLNKVPGLLLGANTVEQNALSTIPSQVEVPTIQPSVVLSPIAQPITPWSSTAAIQDAANYLAAPIERFASSALLRDTTGQVINMPSAITKEATKSILDKSIAATTQRAMNAGLTAAKPYLGGTMKAAIDAAKSGGNAVGPALGTAAGILGLATTTVQGIMEGLNNPDTLAYRDKARQIGSQNFTVGSQEDLRQLAANALYMSNIDKADIQRSAGLVATNIGTSIASGALSGLSTFGPWGLLAGLGTGLAAGIGEISGAALAGKNARIINNLINAANQAASNHLSEAFKSTSEAENFAKMSAIAAEGGKLYKQGTILDVDEEAVEQLKKQGYKFKILQ